MDNQQINEPKVIQSSIRTIEPEDMDDHQRFCVKIGVRAAIDVDLTGLKLEESELEDGTTQCRVLLEPDWFARRVKPSSGGE